MGDSRLLDACSRKKWSEACSLLELTLDIDTSSHASMSNLLLTADEFGLNPLHHALLNDVPPSGFCLLDAAILSAMPDSHAEYFARPTNGGSTPLHLAASFTSHPNVIATVLERAPSAIEARDQTGSRPVDRALRRTGKKGGAGGQKSKIPARILQMLVRAEKAASSSKRGDGGGATSTTTGKSTSSGRRLAAEALRRFFGGLRGFFYEEGRNAGRREPKTEMGPPPILVRVR